VKPPLLQILRDRLWGRPRGFQPTASPDAPLDGERASHARIIGGIFRKDIKDGMRDSRIIGALVAPVLIGLMYSFVFTDQAPKQKVRVGVVAASATKLPGAVRGVAGGFLKLSFRTVGDEAKLRDLVARKKIDIGLVVPSGFDQAALAGSSPKLRLLLPTSSSYSGDYVAAILDRSVLRLAQRGPPAVIERTSVPISGSSALVFQQLGMRKYFVLWSVIFLLAMIAVYAVPMSITEELQTHTMDSLLLIASSADFILAKALFGLAYCVVSIPIMLSITRVGPADATAFILSMALSAITLVGIGLLLGSMLSNPNQLSTWGSLISMPLIGAAVAGGLGLPPAVEGVLFVLPTTHTTRLGVNAMAGSAVYGAAWASYAILAGWVVVIYALVFWRLRRMET
jgi:hypothetical protein